MLVECQGLTKDYGSVKAVDDLSFRVEPGRVTGFLGPNGAGKSTTMRLMLGLDHGGGETRWGGKRFIEHQRAAAVVGAHLDANSFHPNRTARDHLLMMASASRSTEDRVDEVIRLMGLEAAANRRPRGFSMGMGQRLGLASAILADPQVLVLDEPANGLDPQSIHWLRDYLRSYASNGRSVFVSSHLLSEMELMADHLVVIARGRLVANEPLEAFIQRATSNDVFIRSPQVDQLAAALAAELPAGSFNREGDGYAVRDVSVERVGDIALRHRVPVHELTKRSASLEQAFLESTDSEQQFRVGE